MYVYDHMTALQGPRVKNFIDYFNFLKKKFFCVNKWMFEWLELFLHLLSRSHVYTVQTLNGMHLSINAVIEMQ